MNNIIMGKILPFLITFAVFSGERLFASQVQVSSVQIQQSPASSDSDRGGRSLFRDADQRQAEHLVEKGDKSVSQGCLQKAREIYATAALLGSKQALEKLASVADEFLNKLFFKEARDFYAEAARFGHKEAQQKLALLIIDTKPVEIPLKTQESETFLVFKKPSDCEDYAGELRHQAHEKKQNEAKRA